MIHKKDRLHHSGTSNIDYRSLKELEKVKLYNPWYFHKEYGTMGNSLCHKKFKELKQLMKPSAKINTQFDLARENPNPMFHETAKHYSVNHVKILQKSFFANEHIGQLDESLKGKEIFTGDSMMIAKSTKERKKSRKHKSSNKKARKEKEKEALIAEKSSINKAAMQETQLVKIEAGNTLEGKIDLAKIKEIRLALRRRYASRTNFRKIFKEWDFTGSGEIGVFSGHKMINMLGIPINFNETRALISSSNKRCTESLNMEEFMHLIFNDNQTLNLDLKNIKCKYLLPCNRINSTF